MTGQDFQRLTVRAAHLRNIGALVTRAAYRVEVHGRHHVPTEGPVLLVAPGLNLVSAGIVASVARRPLHTLAPWASPALGDIPVISPGIGAARWAIELLAGGAAIMVTTSVPPIGYLLAHGPMSIISVVVIGGSGKVANDPPRLRSKIQVYFSAPRTIEVSSDLFGSVDPCEYRYVSGLDEMVRQIVADETTESGRRSGRPVTGKVHQ